MQAVLALDEPWREVLLLRYVQGLEPAEIARRLGIPGSTVRNRLAHGLELVRARLDRQHGGERGAWSVVLLAGTRTPPPATTLVAAGAAGGLLMNLKWTVAVASVALLAVLVVVQQREEGRNGRAAQESGAAAALLPAPRLEDEPVAPPVAARVPAEDPAREQAESSTSTTLATLEVLLRWSDGVTPATDLPIVLERWYAAGAPLERSARSDAEGRATFAELAPGTYLVSGRCSVSDFVELEAGRTQVLELVFRPGVDWTSSCSMTRGHRCRAPACGCRATATPRTASRSGAATRADGCGWARSRMGRTSRPGPAGTRPRRRPP